MLVFESDIAKDIVERYGCTFVDSYCLINNSGIVFTLDGIKYDARHWRNVYGVSTNFWDIMLIGGGKIENETIKAIEKELNEKCLNLI